MLLLFYARIYDFLSIFFEMYGGQHGGQIYHYKYLKRYAFFSLALNAKRYNLTKLSKNLEIMLECN